ncbi:MAG: hypothetical protein GY751_11515 [Bacteroidetes bacterium]|nr:hypothetical protein [Bacteroidota bacterium]
MIQELRSGGYHEEGLTWLLKWDDFGNNHRNNNTLFTALAANDHAALASCHPNARAIMNLVCTDNTRPNEGNPVLETGDAARNIVRRARQRVNRDNRAIWVQYGEHSFVLLTGTSNILESLEGWALSVQGDDGYYGLWFHRCVLYRADEKRPTRDQAQRALRLLLEGRRSRRSEGADTLSRSGLRGFSARRAFPERGIGILWGHMLSPEAFRTRVRSRLKDVCYWVAEARIAQEHHRYYCCICLSVLRSNNRVNSRWRHCTSCGRYYCRACKHRLTKGWDFMGAYRTRTCECGQCTGKRL